MKVSLNIVKQFLDFELPPVDDLVRKIGSQLGEVESVESLGEKYKDAVIVKIVSCEKHPNADKLSVCKIDDGGKTKDVERDENGLVLVVCGAPNVRTDMLAVWLPPKSIVPASLGDKEPFVLAARELRGVISNGMLAAGDELDINSDHDGILEIQPDEWKPSDIEIKLGTRFAEAYGLDDTIIDIENKMFTHRPDCFGQLGVAREIAGILGHKFISPQWYADEPKFEQATDLALEVFNGAPEKVPRFMAVAIKDVEVRPSPLWLQCALVAMGSKPINNIVDVTNYIMLLTAQPTHAYDYDKLRGHKLGVRLAKKEEKVALLNGKTYELTDEDIVIVDGEGVVGIGGVMGGLDSEVTNETKNIVLECANFDMYSIRKTSMRHGLFTDAVTRFNKGQSPLQNNHILNLLLMSIKDVSPSATQAGEVFDYKNFNDQHDDKLGNKWMPSTISSDFINDRLGTDLTDQQIVGMLENVEFYSHDMGKRGGVCVTPPFWRTDIEIPEDVVEEVGRLYGYDKLPLELPEKSIKPAAKNELLELKQQIRNTLSKSGANEVLTYSFVHGDLLEKVGQDKSRAFQISNALSPDLQYYRLSLTPSLLDKVHMNIKAGHDQFALFELGKAHIVGELDPVESTAPKEVNALSFVYADKHQQADAAYYRARKYLMNLLAEFGAADSVKLESLADADLYKNPWLEQMTAPFEPGRSAVLRDTTDSDTKNLIWGVVGELKASVTRSLKLPPTVAGFEIDPLLFARQATGNNYVPLPRFPKVTQDITLKVSADLSYQNLYDFVWSELAKVQPPQTLPTFGPVGIYQSEDDTSHKNVTFRLEIASYDQTLTDKEVNELLDAVAAAAKTKLKAERI